MDHYLKEPSQGRCALTENQEQGDFSHLDARGRAKMVDVGAKSVTRRRALAECWVDLGQDLCARIGDGDLPKGDVLAVARIAGIQAAKRTSELIPLCHGLPLDQVRVELEVHYKEGKVRIETLASCSAKTGVEMEALTAASVAALTLYDMCKGVRKGIRIEGLRLLKKEGGRSGTWTAEDRP
jgi:cyclic pyranopterin phosphate synthase